MLIVVAAISTDSAPARSRDGRFVEVTKQQAEALREAASKKKLPTPPPGSDLEQMLSAGAAAAPIHGPMRVYMNQYYMCHESQGFMVCKHVLFIETKTRGSIPYRTAWATGIWTATFPGMPKSLVSSATAPALSAVVLAAEQRSAATSSVPTLLMELRNLEADANAVPGLNINTLEQTFAKASSELKQALVSFVAARARVFGAALQAALDALRAAMPASVGIDQPHPLSQSLGAALQLVYEVVGPYNGARSNVNKFLPGRFLLDGSALSDPADTSALAALQRLEFRAANPTATLPLAVPPGAIATLVAALQAALANGQAAMVWAAVLAAERRSAATSSVPTLLMELRNLEADANAVPGLYISLLEQTLAKAPPQLKQALVSFVAARAHVFGAALQAALDALRAAMPASVGIDQPHPLSQSLGAALQLVYEVVGPYKSARSRVSKFLPGRFLLDGSALSDPADTSALAALQRLEFRAANPTATLPLAVPPGAIATLVAALQAALANGQAAMVWAAVLAAERRSAATSSVPTLLLLLDELKADIDAVPGLNINTLEQTFAKAPSELKQALVSFVAVRARVFGAALQAAHDALRAAMSAVPPNVGRVVCRAALAHGLIEACVSLERCTTSFGIRGAAMSGCVELDPPEPTIAAALERLHVTDSLRDGSGAERAVLPSWCSGEDASEDVLEVLRCECGGGGDELPLVSSIGPNFKLLAVLDAVLRKCVVESDVSGPSRPHVMLGRRSLQARAKWAEAKGDAWALFQLTQREAERAAGPAPALAVSEALLTETRSLIQTRVPLHSGKPFTADGLLAALAASEGGSPALCEVRQLLCASEPLDDVFARKGSLRPDLGEDDAFLAKAVVTFSNLVELSVAPLDGGPPGNQRRIRLVWEEGYVALSAQSGAAWHPLFKVLDAACEAELRRRGVDPATALLGELSILFVKPYLYGAKIGMTLCRHLYRPNGLSMQLLSGQALVVGLEGEQDVVLDKPTKVVNHVCQLLRVAPSHLFISAKGPPKVVIFGDNPCFSFSLRPRVVDFAGSDVRVLNRLFGIHKADPSQGEGLRLARLTGAGVPDWMLERCRSMPHDVFFDSQRPVISRVQAGRHVGSTGRDLLAAASCAELAPPIPAVHRAAAAAALEAGESLLEFTTPSFSSFEDTRRSPSEAAAQAQSALVLVGTSPAEDGADGSNPPRRSTRRKFT
ncbi:hypothetical protein EMIHUDRAFT_206437 [Emiliania huxleyi CCMP1516]|uniref:Uncharacterized protein n=2 Tax=Emiliania huxleyi TaxID=2903 RepID=A0A0D3JNZ9_EMIH1|nr:hypothetical protein EMIHUDRAFT_206437 [Emiliania huxleyi CCMP1516]EOD25234.1 hypothetical protein EMIHUDRAFT_206437 [Emiliania huxleyi CCMP1516]|eukprot:XP_005777663.1 hypothetical protein EMIHUDRAFT_206437 [Emiliania huxleyi CCMP1516]